MNPEIIFTIAAAVCLALSAFAYWKARRTLSRAKDLSDGMRRREDACRDAMRRNGEVSRILDEQRRKLDASLVGVAVEYAVTDRDRESYAEDRLPAVAKSRIANKLGHEILKALPDALSGDAGVYKVDVKVLKP